MNQRFIYYSFFSFLLLWTGAAMNIITHFLVCTCAHFFWYAQERITGSQDMWIFKFIKQCQHPPPSAMFPTACSSTFCSLRLFCFCQLYYWFVATEVDCLFRCWLSPPFFSCKYLYIVHFLLDYLGFFLIFFYVLGNK